VQNKKNKKGNKMQILGHEITVKDSDIEISDDNIYVINQAILDGNDCGVIIQDGVEYDWGVRESNPYLDEKAAMLEDKGEVVFEHKQMIFAMFLNTSGEYEYNIYTSQTIQDADTLDIADGGTYDGSARDAIDFSISE
jgi:hypothetical protein